MFSFIYWIDISIRFIPAGCVDADRVFHWCVRGGAKEYSEEWGVHNLQWWKGDKIHFERAVSCLGFTKLERQNVNKMFVHFEIIFFIL
jgi:hypothetical protein